MKAIKKVRLNLIEQRVLVDSINSGHNVKVNRTPKSQNKGYIDTPLFLAYEQEKQQKLF